jgi:uroporphyrinogen-III decarboxylase
MDVRTLKPAYGRDITFFGNISALTISDGTDEEIEEEVRSKVEAAKPGGGYIFCIDHSTPPGVSLRNNRFMFECARKYAHY